MESTWIYGGITALTTLAAVLYAIISSRPGRNGLNVEHIPNPTGLHTSILESPPPYPFAWYYRTEVTNISDRTLEIVWFEFYLLHGHRWISSNILRRTLTTEVFMHWYKVEGRENDGRLLPGEKAICEINWHAFDTPVAPLGKWVFYAIDERGRKYWGGAEIVSVPHTNVVEFIE